MVPFGKRHPSFFTSHRSFNLDRPAFVSAAITVTALSSVLSAANISAVLPVCQIEHARARCHLCGRSVQINKIQHLEETRARRWEKGPRLWRLGLLYPAGGLQLLLQGLQGLLRVLQPSKLSFLSVQTRSEEVSGASKLVTELELDLILRTGVGLAL